VDDGVHGIGVGFQVAFGGEAIGDFAAGGEDIGAVEKTGEIEVAIAGDAIVERGEIVEEVGGIDKFAEVIGGNVKFDAAGAKGNGRSDGHGGAPK